ncbi:MAG TPA: di-heme oxidoredictase family protein [Pirellulaceae bacterium]|nr:di-heme oxidoredictase family protein [Pirellulaceae bacterium]
MRTKIRGRCVLMLALLAAVASLPGRLSAQDAAAVIAAGKALFERQFVAGEPINAGGDGLGPVFNHVSCLACHHQGGAGGSGPVDVNASMLSVDLIKLETAPERSEFRRALAAIHPGFISADGELASSVILHRFGSDARYNAIRQKFLGAAVPLRPDEDERGELQGTLARAPAQPVKAARPLTLVVTQRNTTALFGAGLIDQIPDATLHAIAALQSKHPEVSGRVAPIDNTKVGRFGWRGQIEHLHEFNLGACSNELGLQVPTKSQPMDPLRPEYKPSGLDLTIPQCLSLTAFVASLPAPKVVRPNDPDKLRAVEHGYKVFQAVGCVVCHVETVGSAQGIYSDLLLHDLGPSLADPVEAQPVFVMVEQVQIPIESAHDQDGTIVENRLSVSSSTTTTSNTYYGRTTTMTSTARSILGQGVFYKTQRGFMTVVPDPKQQAYGIRTKYEPLPTNLTQEWRTPPLWGLQDSAPYLHDGRAATVIEAIALHGGEAEACTKRYLGLPAGDRLAMLAFLECLRAP